MKLFLFHHLLYQKWTWCLSLEFVRFIFLFLFFFSLKLWIKFSNYYKNRFKTWILYKRNEKYLFYCQKWTKFDLFIKFFSDIWLDWKIGFSLNYCYVKTIFSFQSIFDYFCWHWTKVSKISNQFTISYSLLKNFIFLMNTF